jgi:hypothetical protein
VNNFVNALIPLAGQTTFTFIKKTVLTGKPEAGAADRKGALRPFLLRNARP